MLIEITEVSHIGIVMCLMPCGLMSFNKSKMFSLIIILLLLVSIHILTGSSNWSSVRFFKSLGPRRVSNTPELSNTPPSSGRWWYDNSQCVHSNGSWLWCRFYFTRPQNWCIRLWKRLHQCDTPPTVFRRMFHR